MTNTALTLSITKTISIEQANNNRMEEGNRVNKAKQVP